jgi:hypothetical protein
MKHTQNKKNIFFLSLLRYVPVPVVADAVALAGVGVRELARVTDAPPERLAPELCVGV